MSIFLVVFLVKKQCEYFLKNASLYIIWEPRCLRFAYVVEQGQGRTHLPPLGCDHMFIHRYTSTIHIQLTCFPQEYGVSLTPPLCSRDRTYHVT